MRDSERIKEFCKRLANVWEENPDMRFFQLISNIMSAAGSDLYYTEDEQAIELIEKYMGRFKNGK